VELQLGGFFSYPVTYIRVFDLAPSGSRRSNFPDVAVTYYTSPTFYSGLHTASHPLSSKEFLACRKSQNIAHDQEYV